MKTTQLLHDGFVFPEAPRWHDGALWFSDQHAHKVYRLAGSGEPEVVVELDDMPSGLGFLPDGTPLISGMRTRCVYRLDGAELTVHADVSDLGAGWLNDMVVDGRGRTFAGFTYGRVYTNEQNKGVIVRIEPDGSYAVAAEGVAIPNGSIVTPDGGTLIVGESGARRLTAFSIGPDGSLADRRTFAEFDSETPDGSCLDAEGAIWMASPRGGRFIRVRDGGEVIDEIPVEHGHPIACMLGGDDRRTLYLIITHFEDDNFNAVRMNDSHALDPQISRCAGRIETVEVEVAGVGWP